MKNYILALFICFLLANAGVPAQAQPEYEITEQDPTKLARLTLTFDYLYGLFATKNLSGGSVDFGLTAQLRPTNFVELNGTFHLPLIPLEKPAPVYFDGNGVLYLRTWKKQKDVRIIRSIKETSTTTYTSYLEIPGEVMRKAGVRGGVYFRSNSFKLENDFDNISGLLQTGLYGGLQLFENTNTRIRYNDDEGYSEGGAFLYADLLLLTSKFDNDYVRDTFKATEGNILPFGWRIGLLTKPSMPSGISKRSGFFGNTELRAEIGWRPVEKFFFNFGAGWVFLRK